MRGLLGFCRLPARFSRVAYATKDVWSVNCAGLSLPNRAYVFHAPAIFCMMNCDHGVQHLSTLLPEMIQWEGSSYETLLKKLEIALKDGNVDEAWEAFNNFKRLHDFPTRQLVSRIIVLLSYSSSRDLLQKAYDMVREIHEEKPHLLDCSSLSRLALILARSQMPIHASTILRIILEIGKLPSVDILCTVFLHLVKTQVGSYLAMDVLIESCKLLLHESSDRKKFKKVQLIKPNITLFNLVLDSCARFGCTMKAQEIIQLMPLVGLMADADTIITISRIYEMTGQRDELKKLKGHIDCISSVSLIRHYRQFYDSLLSLHFKYDDIDAASELLLDLYGQPKPFQSSSNGFQNYCLMHSGSSNLKTGHKITVELTKKENCSFVDAQSHPGLVIFVDGKLVPSVKALAKLINSYVKERKVGRLSSFLVSVYKGLEEPSLGSDVIDACIHMGWLDVAHDILDDLESGGVPVGVMTYKSLLTAYYKQSKLEESEVLLKQIEKAGLFITDTHVGNSCTSKDIACNPTNEASIGNTYLVECLEKEFMQEDHGSGVLYEINNSITFFCKAKMMGDALKTFKHMRQRNIKPTLQTFSHLLNGCSSLNMYREITILWGEIKRELEVGSLTADRDLFDCLLVNFLKGGYFERVMEIISYMTRHKIYADKWKYRREFLKFHKNLYRNLKSSNIRTDAQINRLEHVRAFRLWAGIHQR
ncbi:pentatricopeptide repeat-containing protein At4g17616 isoform X1 [Typha angustifolia]|uniref:pentatricopeptide repeat-containing protein At4g17616 isoform X1 n=1 Tax=Typha angustifolia TaxID=59011 RepID=UPI003C2B9ADD